ncbi:DUF3021 domain-containing protein [Paenibacillus sp. WQ 127069]|uniref:DUF3021 domain-containing protein n=1 Tax=Paenibacillus baimaensis TaxID=2982185 RepID=A0ABT2UEL8_9BACL|nr:DUF3021 domain-containing protein [Paenibacillus sp. WQ 127069]MCU6793084.1 DUF3021 domain-containing protein [Paenibacillus sp. WQ 127069]
MSKTPDNEEIDDNDRVKKYGVKRLIIAGLLSLFFPGLGQIYNGQVKKAIKFMLVLTGAYSFVVYVSNWITSFFFELLLVFVIGFVVLFTIVIWIYNIFDSILNAKRINREKIVIEYRFWYGKKSIKYILISLGVLLLVVLVIKTNSHSPLLKKDSPFLNWEYSNSGTKESLRSIKYTGKQFIVVGDEGVILLSSNGINWDRVNSNTIETLYDVAYGNERYVAVGRNILTSVDAKTWTNVYDFQKGKGDFTNVTFGDGKFVATRYNGSIAISTDGGNWREISKSPNSITGLEFADNKFIAIGDCAKGVTSNNGINWTSFIADNETANKSYCDFFTSINYSNGRYIAAVKGYDDIQFGKVFVSGDGLQWKKVIEFGDNPNGIAINDKGEAVAVGSRMLLESKDTINWKSYKLDKYSNSTDMDSLESVAYGNGKFIAVGIRGVILMK